MQHESTSTSWVASCGRFCRHPLRVLSECFGTLAARSIAQHGIATRPYKPCSVFVNV